MPTRVWRKKSGPFEESLTASSHEREKRQEEQQAQGRGEDGDNLARELLRGADTKSFAVEEIRGAKSVKLNLAVEALAQGAVFFDRDALEAQRKQFLDGEFAAP